MTNPKFIHKLTRSKSRYVKIEKYCRPYCFIYQSVVLQGRVIAVVRARRGFCVGLVQLLVYLATVCRLLGVDKYMGCAGDPDTHS